MIYLSGSFMRLRGTEGIGYMLSPMKNRPPDLPFVPWAADNGCFASPEKYSDAMYLAWLRAHDPSRCLFATAPDALCDWERTVALSVPMLPRIRAIGFPVAFIGQDGQPVDAVPWQECDALFLGGSTAWKLGEDAAALAGEAKRRGKWLHMGRVNSGRRMRLAQLLDCDSVDGTPFAPDRDRGRITGWLDAMARQPMLGAE